MRECICVEWLGMVRMEVAERLSRSRVHWHAPLAVSALSGEGLDELRTALVAIAGDLADRPVDDLFRLPVDRVFALAGAGTVVTGSTWSGTVKAGASVRLLPLHAEGRGRSMEVSGEETARAAPGRGPAPALVGGDKEELERGHVALTGAGWAPTPALEVALGRLPPVRKPLATRARTSAVRLG